MTHVSSNLKDLLRAELESRYALNASDEWLTAFLSTINRPPPLPALTSTAHFRLISTDFTTTLIPRSTGLFPVNISDVQIKTSVLQGDTPVQILDIVDTSSSKYSQIEALERVERGEEIRGREVIRNVSTTGDQGSEDERGTRDGFQSRTTGNSATFGKSEKKGTTGPHKLLLQDVVGTKAWGFELSRIERITIVNTNLTPMEGAGQVPIEGMQIGCKMLVKKGTKIRRGLVMLSPSNVNVMGGKVDAWDKNWRMQRKTRLQEELEAENVA